MPTIFLFRHGETHWNREKRIQGQGDSPLTLKGIEQARAYGRTLRSLLEGSTGWRIISSPLPRCVQTTGILCEEAGLDFSILEMDARLREVSTGEWSGLLKSQMDQSLLGGSGTNSWFFRCPGGESHADVSSRLSSWLAERVAGEKLVVVSHGVAGRVLRGLHAGADPDEALSGTTPQDAFYCLRPGQTERIACN